MSALLRLTHSCTGGHEHNIEAGFETSGLPRQIANARFNFSLNAQDQEDLRWYLEDFLEYPLDPAPKIAARIETRITQIGLELFKAVFQSSDDTRDLWATIRTQLSDTRVEIISGLREAATIPWELIRDPKTDTPLALRANAFVRAHPQAAQTPYVSPNISDVTRILIVICRHASNDVPFRSVAGRLIRGLSENARKEFQLDVLRPPTFEQLGRVLRTAKADGRPYHIVHFDGHGLYADVQKLRAIESGPSNISFPFDARDGAHGYLLFENSSLADNMQLVDGTGLGQLLVETGVEVLIMNACQSAFTEPPLVPVNSESSNEDSHARIRSFGSLAHEIVDAGIAGVVAMRYSVYVPTASQFVADLYSALAQGQTLGQAVTLGRKQLATQPLRKTAYKTLMLQDWCVPVVYESVPISLFPKRTVRERLVIDLQAANASGTTGISQTLPPPPDIGFFGRDEILLALDRAFDGDAIVLLHAYAGSGKTATVAEFARWYALTGGVDGPTLFTSFEKYKPLAHVLDQFAEIFDPLLEQAGIHWLTLSDQQRREVTLQTLKQVPIFWIWDNVEPVSGFPSGTASEWSESEQQELIEFLRAAKTTRAKFLITSRRDELSWLSNLPARVFLTPMRMPDRMELAKAIAAKQGKRIKNTEVWLSLLEFSEGNPLTVIVATSQALRERLTSKRELERFVSKLRAGESMLSNDVSESRSISLQASLSYGLESAFTQDERKKLALLSLFQSYVGAVYFFMVCNSIEGIEIPEGNPDLTVYVDLLDRAAEVGLLNKLYKGLYSIHPALPWYFGILFKEYYAQNARHIEHAFVEVMSAASTTYFHTYQKGKDVATIGVLSTLENSLLNAWRLARKHEWWDFVIGTLHGLSFLYKHLGRKMEWARIISETLPDFVDPATSGPLSGKEEQWSIITQFRIDLARDSRHMAEAERLARTRIEWHEKRAADAMVLPPTDLDSVQRDAVDGLATSIEKLGHVMRDRGQAECVSVYKEAIRIYQHVDDQPAIALVAASLAQAYLHIPAIADLQQAERWLRKALELNPHQRTTFRGMILSHLGEVERDCFIKLQRAKRPREEWRPHFNQALRYYQDAIPLIPQDDIDKLASLFNDLGILFSTAGFLDKALDAYKQAIRYEEAQGDSYAAANVRFNIARDLHAAERNLSTALDYAYAALQGYAKFGNRADKDIQDTRKLIKLIERDIGSKQP